MNNFTKAQQYILDNYYKCDKSSAVAEMSDRLATTDMGRKVEAAVPPFLGSWVPI